MYQCQFFCERDLVYLLASHASSLQPRATKFHQDYISPLEIEKVVAFLPVPTGTAAMQGHLNKAIHDVNCIDSHLKEIM